MRLFLNCFGSSSSSNRVSIYISWVRNGQLFEQQWAFEYVLKSDILRFRIKIKPRTEFSRFSAHDGKKLNSSAVLSIHFNNYCEQSWEMHSEWGCGQIARNCPAEFFHLGFLRQGWAGQIRIIGLMCMRTWLNVVLPITLSLITNTLYYIDLSSLFSNKAQKTATNLSEIGLLLNHFAVKMASWSDSLNIQGPTEKKPNEWNFIRLKVLIYLHVLHDKEKLRNKAG